MNSTQFAWLYLIENGAAGVEPSYYGGYDVCDRRMKSVKLDWMKLYEGYREEYLTEIKSYGVDWNKTKAPESDMVSKFEGTFCDSSLKEYIKGVLVLNNGLKQTWYAESIDVSNIFEMMAKASEAEQRAIELFGVK